MNLFMNLFNFLAHKKYFLYMVIDLDTSKIADSHCSYKCVVIKYFLILTKVNVFVLII